MLTVAPTFAEAAVVSVDLLLGALAAALAALLATSAKVLRDYVVKWGEIKANQLQGLDARGKPLKTVRQRWSEAFQRSAQFYDQVEGVKRIAGVERVLVFVGGNHGGIPDATKEYRVICLHGWAQDQTKNPESAYNFKLLVDKGYCLMLAEMIRAGKAVQTFATMPEMLLKKYYRIEGVFQSVVYFLHLDEDANELMFVSFASYTRAFTEQEIEVMDVRVDRMRSILEGKDGTGDYLAMEG